MRDVKDWAFGCEMVADQPCKALKDALKNLCELKIVQDKAVEALKSNNVKEALFILTRAKDQHMASVQGQLTLV
jgi:hypothetical protein